MKTNWPYKYFTVIEFIENPIKHGDPLLLGTLDKFREVLGASVFPSPVPGAFARFDGSKTSHHYAVGRKSTAIDIYCDCTPMNALFNLMSLKDVGGIGVYLDGVYRGKPWVRFHMDTRFLNKRLVWYVLKGKYYYVTNETKMFELYDSINKRKR